MKAIILAAGRGSRMAALTDHLPKCLVQLKNKPLLSYQIEALQSVNIPTIGVVCGYAKDKITDPRIDQKFENTIWQTSNMVRSLLAATEWLTTSTCIISYADIFYDSAALTTLIASPADITIAYDCNFLSLWSRRFTHPLADLETFALDSDNNLCEIGNKATTLNEIQGQYMGLLKITPSGWRHIANFLRAYSDEEINQLDMTGLLQRLIGQQITIHAVPFSGKWGEVDSQSDLALYESW